MSPKAQRIAIAEACGWTQRNMPSGTLVWVTPQGVNAGRVSFLNGLPDYLNDLNAMHEAEKVLKKQGLWDGFDGYVNVLCGIIDNADTTHTTAAQRAEAFLRTIGKWKDNE